MVLEVIRALGRRWYIVVVGLLVTAGLAAGAYLTTPPEYNARSLVLLLPSKTAVGEGGNPFLTLGGLEQPAGILVAYFSSAPARDAVKQESPTAQYVVGIDDSTRGPVIAVDVTDTSPQNTLDTLRYITDQIPVELAALQNQVDAPSDAVITSMTLTFDQEAERSMGGTIRMVIAALAVGLVATCIAAFALDGLLRRRRLRRTGTLPPTKKTSSEVDAPDADVPDGEPDSDRASTTAERRSSQRLPAVASGRER